MPPLPFGGPPGPVHNIVPLYESVEEGHNDGLPYEEPTGTLIINEVATCKYKVANTLKIDSVFFFSGVSGILYTIWSWHGRV